MALYEVTSGNITANVRYQVVGGTSITYNSVVYVTGEFFTGVSGVTTYTKTGGTEIVTEASYINDISVSIENDYYTDLFNDASMFFGVSVAIQRPSGGSQIIRQQRR